jgi:3-oxoacyl-[acyl-carrier-protein] synthase-3
MRHQGVLTNERICIRGLGHYYPERVVTNADLADIVTEVSEDAYDDVVGKVRSYARHWAAEGETEIDMATKATQIALEDAELEPEDIDLLIVTNWTGRLFSPEMAPMVSLNVGMRESLAFDVCAACAGFVLSMQTAWNYLRVSEWRRAVVVASEIFSRRVRPGSIGHFIAGDGAGAVILERTAEADPEAGLIDGVIYSDGSHAQMAVAVPPEGWGVTDPRFVENAIRTNSYAAKTILQRNKLRLEDVDWVVPHPGTTIIYEGVKQRLEIPDDKIVVNFECRGNTSSASIPVVLSEFYRNGTFKRGDLFLTPAVGSGWFYGALLFRL